MLALYFYCDETKVTSFGSAKAYPLHMGIGNFTAEARSRPGGSEFLLAYLPYYEALDGNKKKASVKIRKREIRQGAIDIVLAPLLIEQDVVREMLCPDGRKR